MQKVRRNYTKKAQKDGFSLGGTIYYHPMCDLISPSYKPYPQRYVQNIVNCEETISGVLR